MISQLSAWKKQILTNPLENLLPPNSEVDKDEKIKPTKSNSKPKSQPTNDFLIFAVLYCDMAFIHSN